MSSSGIIITCAANEGITHDLLSDVPYIHKNRKRTEYRTSIHNIDVVLKLLRGIDETNIDTAPPAVQELWYKEMMLRGVLDDLLRNGPVENPVVNRNLTLKRHQQLGREVAKRIDRYAFFYDTRTGKTPMSLSIINDSPKDKWLVICPLILIENAWLEDAATFFPEMNMINCHADSKAKRIKQFQKESNVYVTNVESFVDYKEYFDVMGFTGCIVDESSTMKSNKSKVSNAIVDFAHTVRRFYLLSGTPAPNGEYEYYQQLRAIDYYCLHQSYTQFKEYFFNNVSFNPQYEKLQVRPDRRQELQDMIHTYAMYVDKEDVLTTPGRTFHEEVFKLPDEVKEAYKQVKDKLYLEIDQSTTITVPSAAAKLNKLNQLTSGFILDTQVAKENKFYGESNKDWHLLSDYRFRKLQELLDRPGIRGAQVLIWANYHKEFELISEMLGVNCRCVYGKTSLDDKNAAIRLFKSKQIQYLVANPASADKGLTLTNAHISIYFSLNWSYELFKQSMERIYGDIMKQPLHCEYYIMIAEGTIDRVLYSDVLLGKGSASAAVLNHLKPGDVI